MQVKKQRFNPKWIIQKILYESWTDSGLQVSIRHSCALFWVKWCWLGMWGIDVRPTQKMTSPSNFTQKELKGRTTISGGNNSL